MSLIIRGKEEDQMEKYVKADMEVNRLEAEEAILTSGETTPNQQPAPSIVDNQTTK